MKKAIAKIAVSAIATVTAAATHAGPPQLDILGLVAGVSTKADVEKTRSGFVRKGDSEGVYLEIGGHRIFCAALFRDTKLDTLGCLTGKNQKAPLKTKESNIQIYNDLKVGFTKKFGPPDVVDNQPARNALGAELENENVTWLDARGGVLHLEARRGKIDEGRIILISPEAVKQSKEKQEAEEAKKKF